MRCASPYPVDPQHHSSVLLLELGTSHIPHHTTPLCYYWNWEPVASHHSSVLLLALGASRVPHHSTPLRITQVSFGALASRFKQLAAEDTLASRLYASMTQRYPTNVRLLRSYARFLEGVKGDPWKAYGITDVSYIGLSGCPAMCCCAMTFLYEVTFSIDRS